MSNFTYNPNVDLTDYMPKEQMMNNYQQQPQMEQYTPQQYMQPPPQQYTPPPVQHQNYVPQQYSRMNPPRSYKKPAINKIEKLDVKVKEGFLKQSFLKKVAVYFILFIIFSHKIMDSLICMKLTFLQNNEILCLLTRGLLFVISLLLSQYILKL